MANSIITYIGDGSTIGYALNFTLGILRREYVQARVGDEVDGDDEPVYRDLEWVNDGFVNIQGDVPADGEAIVFTRTMPKDELIHDYTDGAAITEKNLDESNLQTIMSVHEFLDGRLGAGFVSNFSMSGFRITDLGDAVDPTDAVTLQQLEDLSGNAPAYAAQAADSAAAAALSVNNLTATSSSSVVIGLGSKVFTVPAGKTFHGNYCIATSAADVTKYVTGPCTLVGTTLTMTVSSTGYGGSGTLNDWIINVCGKEGATGATGPSGGGSGNVVGPVSSVVNNFATWNNTGGTSLKDSGVAVGSIASQAANAVAITGGDVDNCDFDNVGVMTFADADSVKVELGLDNVPNVDSQDADNLNSGTVDPARLGSGTPDNTTVLYGNGVWGPATPLVAPGAIGSYAQARRPSGASSGTISSGVGLIPRYGGGDGAGHLGNSTQWKCMYVGTDTGITTETIWQRIS